MKAIYVVLMLAFAIPAGAQDYCQRIKKEVSPDKTTFEFISPFDPAEKPAVHVKRTYNIDPEYAYDNFYLVFRVPGELESIYEKTADGAQAEKIEHSIVVEFDDNSKVVDDSININHDFSDDRTQTIRYLDFPIDEKTMNSFATKKIVKFRLAGFEQPVPADSAVAVMHYVQCIKSAK